MAAHQALHPWDSPGKNTGVGCHFLLQCMKVKSESEVTQSCLTLWYHGLQPTRLLCPWDFPGKSTGMGCHCFLQKGVEYSTYLTKKASLFDYVSLKVVGHSLWNVDIHTLAKIGISQRFHIMPYMWLWLNYAGKIIKRTHWSQISRPTPRGRVAETWCGRKGM